MKKIISFLFCIGIVTNLSFGQEKVNPVLDNTRLYASREFATDRVGEIKWLNAQDAYTIIEKSNSIENTFDIAQYDAKTGARSILVKAENLVPQNKKEPLTIDGYELSPDSRYMLVFTNTKRVWRYNTIGDYWLFDMQTKTLKQLGDKSPESSLMFAKFSPDNKQVAYVVRENGCHNIFTEDIGSGKIIQLTSDGSITTINGTFDWAYEEEFGCRDGFRWSTDSKQIAYWQIDASGIGVFNMINYTDSLYSKIIPVQYPKVGQTISAARIGVVSASGGATTWLPIEGNARAHYLPYMDWTLNANELMVQQMNRNQTWNKLLRYNTDTKTLSTLFTDTANGAWVEVNKDMKMLKDGSFIWLSEKDGWRHIYRISADGKNEQLLTNGAYEAVSLSAVDEKGGWVYFTASPDNPVCRFLYRLRLDGKGQAERVTPAGNGTHSYQISPSAAYAIYTHSDANTPPKTGVISIKDHKNIRTIAENRGLMEKIATLNINPLEFYRLEVTPDLTLDAWMIKPPHFDPNKKYPVIFYVYGEPANTTVNDSWGGTSYLWHQLMAQKGYIIMSIENRGTPSPRGCEFRKCVYKKVGIVGPEDQANGVKAALKKWSFIDPARVGIWGWSGGGSSTMNAMFKYPDVYAVGVAVAGVPNLLLYDAIYQERYMGSPVENAEGYKNGSALSFAENLKGDLMVIHGTGDDNVHYQGAEQLFNKLIESNKQFEMFLYPNRGHSINEGKNTSRHLRELMTNYWLEHLPAGGK